MSEKGQRSCYKDDVTPAEGLKQFHINVANSKLIIEILTDLAVTYRWYCYLRIPINGCGAIGANTKTKSSGKTTFIDVNFNDYKHLLEEYQHVTINHVVVYVPWFMGDAPQKREKHAGLKDMLI